MLDLTWIDLLKLGAGLVMVTLAIMVIIITWNDTKRY